MYYLEESIPKRGWDMVRVGVPEVLGREWLSLFPSEVEIVHLSEVPEAGTEVEFWIAPLYPKQVKAMCPQLAGVKVVQALLAGVDWVLDVVPSDIMVCDAQGCHNVSTSEWVLMAILTRMKYVPIYVELQAEQDWRGRNRADAAYQKLHLLNQVTDPPILLEELSGKKVLIVGYGSIGRSIEARLAPFEVEIVRMARHAREGVEPVERLKELLPSADIVVLIVPQTEETTGLMGAEELGLMKQGALLINAARGPVVVTDALVAALHAGRIHAAVDVTDPEPLPKGHPLWAAPNIFITPHIASSSPRFMERPIKLAAQQVRRYVQGEPLLNVVKNGY
jgi:phosphoglycerate dehydrogenase-like enzyme